MKLIKFMPSNNQKIIGLLSCLLVVTLVMSACASTPQTPPSSAAPTIDTTALVSQISQTLEAKITQQAALAPAPQSQDTLLPTAVPLTQAPTPTLPSNPVTILVTTLLPSPTSAPSDAPVSTPAAPTALPPLFAVIHVVSGVNHADVTTTCPPAYTFTFSASITTNGAGTVTYNWEFSDNSKTDTKTLTFTSASTQNVSADWALGSNGKTPGSNPYKGWARITIVQPNNQVFPRVPFSFDCQ